MQDRIWFTFNDFDSRHYPEMFVTSVGRRVKTEVNSQPFKIPFRSEELHFTDNTRKPYMRNINVTLLTRENTDKIFSKLSGHGILRTSDDPGVFFICQIFNIIPFSQILAGNDAHDITVPIKIQPYAYLEIGQEWHDITNTEAINNPGTECNPIYRIYGKGIITLNGNEVSYNPALGSIYGIPEYIDIDTDKGIVYNKDIPMGIYVIGDLDDLRLNPGENILTTTASKLEILPRFREE